ncbi:MAG: hypothetical protein IPM14_04270 [bacterium]|nr:hypothetical protein [bacterium]
MSDNKKMEQLFSKIHQEDTFNIHVSLKVLQGCHSGDPPKAEWVNKLKILNNNSYNGIKSKLAKYDD